MKQKLILLISLIAISLTGFSQVNYSNAVGAIQRKDSVGGKVFRFSASDGTKTPLITPSSLADSLGNYTKIADGLISGGNATLGTGSVTIDTAIYRINQVQYIAPTRTFTGISNSPTGTQYYLVVYGNTLSLLDTISGVRDTIAIIPSIPANTVKVNTILVGDGGVITSSPDLSGYAKLIGGNNFYGRQTINDNLIKINTPTSQGGIDFYVGNKYRFGLAAFNDRLNISGGSDDGLTSFRFLDFTRSNIHAKFYGTVEGLNPVNSQDFVTKSYGDANYLTGSPDTTVYRTVANSYSLATGQPRLVSGTNIKTVNSTSLLGSGDLATELPLTFSSPLVRTTNTISIPAATTSVNGYLSSTDWNTFNNKQSTISFGAIGSTPNANGASISSGVITLQPASSSFGGLVTTGTQTLAGQKTLQDTLVTTKGIRNTAMGLGYVGTAVYSADGTMSKIPLAPYVTSGVITKTANYTVTTTDIGSNGHLLIRGDATAGNITITLPVASTVNGITFIVKKIDSSVNTVTISVASTIDGSSTQVLNSQYKLYRITSNGTNYDITGAF